MKTKFKFYVRYHCHYARNVYDRKNIFLFYRTVFKQNKPRYMGILGALFEMTTLLEDETYFLLLAPGYL